jgi:hypothetical protein
MRPYDDQKPFQHFPVSFLARRGLARAAALLLVAVVACSTNRTLEAQSQSSTKKNLDLPFDVGGMPSESDEEAPEVVVFYGQSFEGDGLFYCLDRSGSTAQGELNIEKRETVRNIMDFSPRIQFGVVFYSSDVMRFPSSGRPAEASTGNKAAATAWIMGVTPGSGTCVQRGLFAALDFANRSTARRNVVIYLGDGQTTCPGADEAAYAQRTLLEVRSRNSKNITINAICVGAGVEVSETFPQALAKMNDGQYRRISR